MGSRVTDVEPQAQRRYNILRFDRFDRRNGVFHVKHDALFCAGCAGITYTQPIPLLKKKYVRHL